MNRSRSAASFHAGLRRRNNCSFTFSFYLLTDGIVSHVAFVGLPRMSAAPASLIPELEEVIATGSPERRTQALQRITALFVAGASNFNEDHVKIFDDVFGHLIDEIESKARAELANRLAPVRNAPAKVVRKLAKDDDIAVAGPVLQQS